MASAKALAEKALELEPLLAEPHLPLAKLKFLQRDWQGAELEIRKAIELDPGLAQAHMMLAHWAQAPAGKLDEALASMKQARRLDPLSHLSNNGLGLVYYLKGNWDEAQRYLERSLENNPTFWVALYNLGELYAKKGMLVEAKSQFEKVTPENCPICRPPGAMGNPHVLAMLGKKEEALRTLERGPDLPNERAMTYAVLGQVDLAIEYLEKVIRSPTPLTWHLKYLKTHPIWDPLRGDPRFTELLREAGL
jgi:tetratricopeptide (TPR) repeat protein